MHLLFECENYSEPLWTFTKKVIKIAIQPEVGGKTTTLDCKLFSVLYNIIACIPTKYCKMIMILTQEIKQNIVYHRYQRKTASAGEGVVTYSPERIIAHLTITIQKILNLRKYQGKSSTFLEGMLRAMRNM